MRILKEIIKRIEKLEKKVEEINKLECPYDIKIKKGFRK
jgi:putative IMPACT (imprinted ancient) family translation regulator